MPWYAFVMVGLIALSSGLAVLSVNRPKAPLTPASVLAIIVVNGLFIWGILALAASGGCYG